jgi:hypothetical protein
LGVGRWALDVERFLKIMDAPDPEKERVPSGRLRSFFNRLIFWNKTNTPLPGAGIRTDEYPGQGTMISVDPSTLGNLLPGVTPPAGGFSTITLDVCVDGSPETHTFIITS